MFTDFFISLLEFSNNTPVETRELIVLTILLFPIVVPLIIADVKATGLIFDGKSLSLVVGWLRILFAFDPLFF